MSISFRLQTYDNALFYIRPTLKLYECASYFKVKQFTLYLSKIYLQEYENGGLSVRLLDQNMIRLDLVA